MDIEQVITNKLRHKCGSKFIENLKKWKRDIDDIRSTYIIQHKLSNNNKSNNSDNNKASIITSIVESEWFQK